MTRARDSLRARAAAGLAALLAALGLSAPALAELRRFEVVGALALDPAAPPAAPRQAALRAALEEAVARAAGDLVREAGGQDPQGEPAAPLPGEATEYAVSYRVLEDRGEQDALLAGPPGGREYVVVAEVQIDLDRVRAALRAAGRLAGAPVAPSSSFRLELLDVPSPAAWTAVRAALTRVGAEAVVPVELEPGRAMLEVRGPGGPDRTVERLLHEPLAGGFGLESLPSEPGLPRLRVREAPPEAAEAAPSEPEAIDTESPNRY